jgi:hypothetical protein
MAVLRLPPDVPQFLPTFRKAINIKHLPIFRQGLEEQYIVSTIFSKVWVSTPHNHHSTVSVHVTIAQELRSTQKYIVGSIRQKLSDFMPSCLACSAYLIIRCTSSWSHSWSHLEPFPGIGNVFSRAPIYQHLDPIFEVNTWTIFRPTSCGQHPTSTFRGIRNNIWREP